MISKIKQGIAELGWKNWLFYVLGRALDAASGGRARIFRYALVAQPVADAAHLPPHRGANIEVREIHREDPLIASFPRTAEMIRDRFDQGARCFAATRNGEFMGYIWFSLISHLEDEVRVCYLLPTNARSVWDFDVYVVPEQRMGFIFLRLWDTVYAYLRTRGVQWSISRIATTNLASHAAHKRLGATSIGCATFIVFGPIQVMFSSCRPYVHFSGGRRVAALHIPEPGSS